MSEVEVYEQPVYGYIAEIDYTKTEYVPLAGQDLVEMQKEAYFKVVDANPGIRVTDIRWTPSNYCPMCGAVNDEKTHKQDNCVGAWVRDDTYDF